MTAKTYGEVLRLIELLYDAVEDPQRWLRFMEELCRTLKTTYGFLVLHVPGGSFDHLVAAKSMQIGCPYGWTAEQLDLYGRKYAAIDPYVAGMMAMPEGSVGRGSEICSEAELRASAAYREFYDPNGCHHGCGMFIKRAPEGTSFLSLIRSNEARAYTDAELALLRRLMPHLQRAARLFGELMSLRTQLEAVRRMMDLSPLGFLQVDEGGAVVYANEVARTDDTLSFASGRLRIHARNGETALREALRRSLEDRARVRRVELEGASDGQRRRFLLIPPSKPSGANFRDDPPTVSVLVVGGSSAPKPDPGILSELFSLTPAEARFTALLVAGFSVQEIARKLRIERETARTHLRRILSKTDTRRQGELISLVLRSVPFVGI